MKKMILAAAIAAVLSLTACSTAENNDTTKDEASQAVESETVQDTESEDVQESSDAQDAEDETASETEDSSDEGSSDGSAAEAEPEVFVPVEGLSENYADLDYRAFAYDGQIFTLGETTLQDMVDAGLPFDEGDLNNIGNNINKNYETDRYI